jgi:predicted nucleic acid-binding protein
MKVVVDTSIWIDFFKNVDTPKVDRFDELIKARADICICGFILQEVLQGTRTDHQYQSIKAHFGNLIYLDHSRGTFERAASMYRDLRRTGNTIRSPIDCLIAALAIEFDAYILERDRDYTNISKQFPLRLL